MRTKKKEKNPSDSWRGLFRTIGRLRLPWIWIIIGLALSMLLSNLYLKLPDTTADLLSGNINAASVSKAVIYYIALGVANFVAVMGQVQAQSYSVRRARETVWGKMLRTKMGYFDENDPNDLMSTITNDVGNAVQSFVNIIIYLIPSVYYVVMALMRINEYHWVLALSCFLLLPLKYIYALVMGRLFQKNTSKLYWKIGELTGYLADRINHLPLIKAFTNEEKEDEGGKLVAHRLFKAQMKLVHLDNISSGIIAAMDVLQKIIVVVVAVILLQKGEIKITVWLAFFLFAQTLFSYMDQIFDCWVRIKQIQGGFQRIIDIMDAPAERTTGTDTFPETGDIRFQNVTFTYPGAETPALKDVSFTIPRGSSAAIVGMCGSGKTTSISLLEQFYQAQEGQIFIGDTEISEISLSAFRRNLAYVQQGASVFSGTVRELATYGIEREVSDQEILEAAEKTGFSDYLKLCKEGLDTQVAAGGASMSGGQSQRLVLTREVLRGGDIILMDEPTSALDVRVSAKIQETMDTVFAGKTKILVTHDLEFAQSYDKILVLRDGELVGEGSHEFLLQHCETYKEMIENAKEEVAECENEMFR